MRECAICVNHRHFFGCDDVCIKNILYLQIHSGNPGAHRKWDLNRGIHSNHDISIPEPGLKYTHTHMHIHPNRHSFERFQRCARQRPCRWVASCDECVLCVFSNCGNIREIRIIFNRDLFNARYMVLRETVCSSPVCSARIKWMRYMLYNDEAEICIVYIRFNVSKISGYSLNGNQCHIYIYIHIRVRLCVYGLKMWQPPLTLIEMLWTECWWN